MDPCQKVIWLVDDDPEDQTLIQHAFSDIRPSLSIATFNDGDELIPALETTQPWPILIILDLNMTRMDGIQTLKALHNDPLFGRIPVVILTTSTNPKDQELSSQLGAKAYYAKPFHFREMIDLARKLVNQWVE